MKTFQKFSLYIEKTLYHTTILWMSVECFKAFKILSYSISLNVQKNSSYLSCTAEVNKSSRNWYGSTRLWNLNLMIPKLLLFMVPVGRLATLLCGILLTDGLNWELFSWTMYILLRVALSVLEFNVSKEGVKTHINEIVFQ